MRAVRITANTPGFEPGNGGAAPSRPANIMEIVKINIDELTPDKRNTRKHEKKSIDAIAESISRYGMRDPVGVWGPQNLIVEGHGRVMACRKLGITEVPCIRLDDMTDQERREYATVHNRTAELSSWNKDLLKLELPELNIGSFFPEPRQYNNDERERTLDTLNLHEINLDRLAGTFDMPQLEPCTFIPSDLICFKYIKVDDGRTDAGVHFYTDDYQFERAWNDPHGYDTLLAQYQCVLTPDFSLYIDMPLAVQLWNVYRSRVLGYTWSCAGLTVLPSVRWGERRTFDFCFDGLPEHSVIAVSTLGAMQDPEIREIWYDGAAEAKARLKPEHVVNYGKDSGFDWGCPVSVIKNKQLQRGRGE